MALLLRIYKVFSGTSCVAKVMQLRTEWPSEKRSAEAPSAKSRPKFKRLLFVKKIEVDTFDSRGKFVGHGSEWEFGLGIEVPQGKSLDEPQEVRFKIGVFLIDFSNVVPRKLNSRVMDLLLVILLSLIIAVCIHPFARLLGGQREI